MKDDVIRARVPSALKARASRVLAACGLEPSEAIRLFLQQVVAHGGLPFEVRAADSEPSFSELRSLKRASQVRDRRMAASQGLAAGECLLVAPSRLQGAKVHWPTTTLD